jgi:hypothetical protein
MAIGARRSLLGVALGAALLALLAVGCDNGGLLVVTSISAQGPAAADIVSGGNVAKNGKYVIVYTFGQPTPTPDQGVSTSPDNVDHGGLVGAMNGQ